jgi:hypothetical protein
MDLSSSVLPSPAGRKWNGAQTRLSLVLLIFM